MIKNIPMKGRAHKLGSDINTDYIISGRYKFSITDPQELAKKVFEDLDPSLASRIKEGDFIVAGDNFGCGSSREQAPQALKAAGIQAVIAKYYARIFYRNAINLGLLVLEADTGQIEDGDELELDINNSKINILNKKKELELKKIPDFMQAILKEGGVIEYLKKHKTF
ncbi:MAG: 3-isopropylmalate dehydratase small subunit [Candidatus Omnitrophica bacterium]|nr:3-isopropylmalate dehydratase small subunit [Candidatus Omnitrophota bacterium]